MTLLCRAWFFAVLTVLASSALAVGNKLTEDARAAAAAKGRGDYELAVKLYSRVLASPELPAGDRPKIYFNRGVSYLNSGENDYAVADFTEAIRLDRDLVQAFAYRGSAYINSNQVDKAIADLDAAVALDPNYMAARYFRGIAYLLQDQPDRAMREFDEAIRLEPEDANAYHKRGLTHAIMGDFKSALSDYDAAIARAHKPSPYIYSDRGMAYFQMGSQDLAVSDLDTALRLGAHDGETHYRRGLMLYQYKRDEREEEALKELEQAIRLQPEGYADAYFRVGVILMDRGQRDRAIKNYTNAIRLKPDYVGAYLNRGLAYMFKGDAQLSNADFDTAIRLQPTLADAYLYRGLGHALDGSYDLAFKNLDEALRLKPEANLMPPLYRIRGFVYFAEGQFENAAKNFEEVLKISPHDEYAIVWGYLAHARNGPGSTADMVLNSEQFEIKGWPGPLIKGEFRNEVQF